MKTNCHQSATLLAQYQAQKLKDWFGHLNKPDVTILDFGCGNGLMTNFVQEVFYDSTIMGVDLSSDAIAQASTDFPGITFAHLQNNMIPLAADTFDLVYAANVFHHIPTKQHTAIIKEIMRVLKPDGIFVILELNPYNPWTARSFVTNPMEHGTHMIKPWYTRSLLRTYGKPTIWYYHFFPNMLSWFIPLEPFLWWLPIGSLYATIVKKRP